MRKLVVGILLLATIVSKGQTGVVTGRVFDEVSNEALPFAAVFIEGGSKSTTTDDKGYYRLEGLTPGLYSIGVTFIGYKNAFQYEVQVSSARPATVDFAMQSSALNMEALEVVASPNSAPVESPISLRSISAAEIFRNPGGNRDISRVIQTLPGVATTASFRNDIIIRGGAPNENRFFLDGIEVPNINHFATQGSSGGPVGMINVNFIREVDFYSGAFPSNRGNALSSVFEFKQVEGNREKLLSTFMLGSSDIGITLDGPMGKNSSFILSARRSYLQFLFQALKLPFLPTYNDFQYKQTFNIGDKDKITILGLGAIDDFSLNTSASDNVTDTSVIERNNYILGNLPVNTQWNYAVGAKWQHFRDNSYQTVVLSRNHLNNEAFKYQDNIEEAANLVFDYESQEIENKFRYENTVEKNGWKWNVGAGIQAVRYTNSTFRKDLVQDTVIEFSFSSKLTFNKYAVFSQLSKSFLGERLTLSAGFRTDFNDYGSSMSDPIRQLSPRLSASYMLNEKWRINSNIGRYFQLPAYTVMGFRDETGTLINKQNNITYIQSDHAVAGIEYNPNRYAKITVEGFYKVYQDYPFLLRDSISLANLGGDFGVIGNDAVTSTSSGRSYGIEFLAQQRLSSSVYGILAYTFVRSEFDDKNGNAVASAWDNRHVINATAGKRFKKNWEVGMRFRFSGGAPYTPIDVATSSLIPVWNVVRQGVPDWDRLNSERLPANHGLDMRVDKKWFFKKWSLNVYLDIQNIYNFQAEAPPFLNVRTDDQGNTLIDPNDPSRYQTYFINNTNGTVLPSIGLMIEL